MMSDPTLADRLEQIGKARTADHAWPQPILSWEELDTIVAALRQFPAMTTELRAAAIDYLANAGGGAEDLDALHARTRRVILAAVAPMDPPTDDDIAWARGVLAERQPPAPAREARISDRCPSCGHGTLFVAPGGWLTCSWLGCKQPVVSRALNTFGEVQSNVAAMTAERDALKAKYRGKEADLQNTVIDLGETRGLLQRAREERDAFRADLEVVRALIRAKERAIDAYRERNVALTAERDALRAVMSELDALRARCEALEAALRTIQQRASVNTPRWAREQAEAALRGPTPVKPVCKTCGGSGMIAIPPCAPGPPEGEMCPDCPLGPTPEEEQ